MRNPVTTYIGAVMACGLALVLAACGEDDETATGTSTSNTATETSTAAQGKPLETVSLTEDEYTIRPDSITLERPGIYEFEVRNTGQVAHALEIEGQGIEVETETFGPGRSAKLKADLKPGSYKLYCPVANHEQLGMTGRLTVRGGGGGATTTGTTETESGTTGTTTTEGSGRGRGRGGSGGTPDNSGGGSDDTGGAGY